MHSSLVRVVEDRSAVATSPLVHRCAAPVDFSPWWDPALYPFASRFVVLPTGPLHYIEEGSGPVLLFVPPAPLWSFTYRRCIAELRDEFRCVAFDFPGFGPSPAPAGMRVDLDAMSATVQQFVAALDLRDMILVGHDSGGLIGLHAAGRRAEQFAGLVLVDSIGATLGAVNPIRLMLKLVSSPPMRFVQGRWNVLARAICKLGVRRRKPTAAERGAFLAAYPDRAVRCRPLAVFREMARRDDFFRATEAGVERLWDRPVLSIFGQLDPVRLLGYQRKFARVFPRHRGVVVRGEAHFVPEGAPEEMAGAIRSWWRAESGATRAGAR